MSVYVSTVCLGGKEPMLQRVQAFLGGGLTHIELGASVTVTDDELGRLPQPARYLVHNYFPPPAESFVLNLASPDPSLRRRSQQLARRAITLSKEMGAPFYSVHAGFIEDPVTFDGGHFVFPATRDGNGYEQALGRFVESTVELAAFAAQQGVRLLIENNVCWPTLVGQLLLQRTSEFEEFFGQLHARKIHNVGMLLDFGHLNVSARTLKFDRTSFVERVGRWVEAFHIHDNDGDADAHRPLAADSWILSWLGDRAFAGRSRILECYAGQLEPLRKQVDLVGAR